MDLGFAPSGDGIAAALLTMEALGGADLADRDAMRKLPQVLVNVEVSDRDSAIRDPDLRSAIGHERGISCKSGCGGDSPTPTSCRRSRSSPCSAAPRTRR